MGSNNFKTSNDTYPITTNTGFVLTTDNRIPLIIIKERT